MREKNAYKKLSKNDHSKINNNVKRAKVGLGIAGAASTVGIFMKRYGKDILNTAKNVILRK